MSPADTSTPIIENLSKRDSFLAQQTARYAKNFRFTKRGYRLDEETAKNLAEHAKSDCYKCFGTGVKDYRNHGTKARVCKCVLESSGH